MVSRKHARNAVSHIISTRSGCRFAALARERRGEQKWHTTGRGSRDAKAGVWSGRFRVRWRRCHCGVGYVVAVMGSIAA